MHTFMKTLLILFIATTSAFANYTLYYSGIEVGQIKDFSSLKENYLRIEVTNSLARILLGKDEMIFYNSLYQGSKENKSIKYKKDRYEVINIIKKSITNNLPQGNIHIKENKFIKITKNKDYQYEYVSHGKLKSHGNIQVNNNILIAMIDNKNHIKIIKN